MKLIFILLSCLASSSLRAQELFAYTEPASNMPVKSFAIRANNYVWRNNASHNYSYSFAPELMVGISKKLMAHAELFFGNEGTGFDGASVYLKYRFYSQDEVHSHFRIAAYGKLATSDNSVVQTAIDLAGRNSGEEVGLVATKLMHKLALSAGGSFVHAVDNSKENKFGYANRMRNAFSYNLSGGKLFLPKEYTDYKQVNFNGMLEFLGQTNLGNGATFIDAAPSVQVIIASNIRVDAGYRFPLLQSLSRSADRGFLLRLEYNFFSAF